MASSISVSEKTKRRFDDLKPDGATHDEFVQECLTAFEQSDGTVDPDKWAESVADNLREAVGNKAELGAYRGAKDGVERNGQ